MEILMSLRGLNLKSTASDGKTKTGKNPVFYLPFSK